MGMRLPWNLRLVALLWTQLAVCQELLVWNVGDECLPSDNFTEIMEFIGWDVEAWGQPQRCEERCINNRTGCDDLAYLYAVHAYRFLSGGRCTFDSEMWESWTGSSQNCQNLDTWMSCNCGACDSWKVYCRCGAPSKITSDAVSCLEGEQFFLSGSHCTAQCDAGERPAHEQLLCHGGQWYSADGLEPLSTQELKCITRGLPASPDGTLTFVDDDPRHGQVSGEISFVPTVSSSAWFVAYWGTSDARRIDGEPALEQLLPEGVGGGAWARLSSRALPREASYILLFAVNEDGESELPLSALVIDAIVAPVEPRANQSFVFEAELFSTSVSWSDGFDWRISADQGDCSNGTSMRGDQIVMNTTSSGSQRLILRWQAEMLQNAGLYKVCGLAAEELIIARLFVLPASLPTVEVLDGELVAGVWSRLVLTDPNDMLSSSDMLALTSTACTALASTDLQPSHFATIAEGSSNKSMQLWQQLPITSGLFQVCWNSCAATRLWHDTNDEACWQHLADIDILPCTGCPEPCRSCFQQTPSSCTTLQNESIGKTCSTDANLPLLTSSIGQLRSQDVCVCSFNIDCHDSTYLSVSVSPTTQHIVVADPDSRMVVWIPLDGKSAGTEVGRTSPWCGPEDSCAYILPGVPRRDTNANLVLASCGDGGPASQAVFMRPVAVRHAPSGTYVLIVDAAAHRVRRINIAADGLPIDIITVAGSGQAVNDPTYVDLEVLPAYWEPRGRQELPELHILMGQFTGDGGPALSAQLSYPWDVAIHPEEPGVFIIADRMNHRVRLVSASGTIETVAGRGDAKRLASTGSEDGDGSAAADAWLFEPSGVEWIPQGGRSFIISERAAGRIRMVDSTGRVWTVAGAEGLRAPLQPRLTPSGVEILLIQDTLGTDLVSAEAAISSRIIMALPLVLPLSNCNTSTCVYGEQPEVLAASVSELNLESDAGSLSVVSLEAAAVTTGARGEIFIADMRGAVHRIERRLPKCTNSTRPVTPGEQGRRLLCTCAAGYEAVLAGTRDPYEAASDELMLNCKRCLPGSYCMGGLNKSMLCGGGRTSDSGAASIADCYCPRDYFLYGDHCMQCPQGVDCPAGWDPQRTAIGLHQVRAGYWLQRNHTGYQILTCVRERHCSWPTPSEHEAAQFTHQGDMRCPVDREGFLCGRCADGFVESSLSNCNTCNEASDWILKLLAVIFNIYVIALFYTYLNKPEGQRNMAFYTMSTAATSMAEFMQQYALLAAIVPELKVDFLEEFLLFLHSFDLSGDILQCFFGSSLSARYLVRLMFPWQFILAFVLLQLLLFSTRSIRQRWWPATLPPRFQRIQAFVCVVKTFELERAKVCNALGFAMCCLYTMMTKRVLSLFVIRRPLSYSVTTVDGLPENNHTGGFINGDMQRPLILLTYPDVIFSMRGEFATVLPWAIAAFLVYTLAFLAFHIVITAQAPRQYAVSGDFRVRHKYFFAKYREDCYWWGVVAMSRSLLLMLVFVVGGVLPGSAIWVSLLVQLTYTFLLIHIHPYKVAVNSLLDFSFSTCIACMIAIRLPEAFAREGTGPTFLLVCCVVMSAVVGFLAFAGLLHTCARAERWEMRLENLAADVDGLTRRVFVGEVRQLRLETLQAISREMSDPERQQFLRCVAFLEPALQGLVHETPTDPYPPTVSLVLEGMQRATRSARSNSRRSTRYLSRSFGTARSGQSQGSSRSASTQRHTDSCSSTAATRSEVSLNLQDPQRRSRRVHRDRQFPSNGRESDELPPTLLGRALGRHASAYEIREAQKQKEQAENVKAAPP